MKLRIIGDLLLRRSLRRIRRRGRVRVDPRETTPTSRGAHEDFTCTAMLRRIRTTEKQQIESMELTLPARR